MGLWARHEADSGIKTAIGNHTFRATGITTYLLNGGTLEPGDTLRYTVVLRNSGNARQPNIVGAEFFTTLAPHTLELFPAHGSAGTLQTIPEDNRIRWDGALAVGRQVEIRIEARVLSGATGQICTRGFAQFDTDLNGSNETRTETDNPQTPTMCDATCVVIGQPTGPAVMSPEIVEK